MLGIIAIIAVIAGGIALWPRDDAEVAQTPAPTTATSTPESTTPSTEPPATTAPITTAPPPPDSELLGLIAQAKGFVATTRGHEFRADVDVRAFDPDSWRAWIIERFDLTPERLELEAIGLVGLGLLTPEEAETYVEDVIAAHQQIAGVYADDVIYLRDRPRNAALLRTLVHEFTHALDDQMFGLSRVREDFAPDSEAAETLHLVSEGNATRVESLWLATLAGPDKTAAGPPPLGRDDLATLDGPVDFDLGARYLVGLTFAEHVAAGAGEVAIDRALANPPPTSEQVWFPPVFDRGELRVPVPAPPVPAGAEIADEGPAGVTFWYRMLSSSAAELTTDEVEQAIEGWGGDWRVSWTDGGLLCSRIDVVGDTPTDTDELLAAAEAWAEPTDGLVVVEVVDDRVRVEYCVPDPGGGGESRI